MNTRSGLLILLFFLTAIVAHAGTGQYTVSGEVIEGNTGKPLTY